MIERIEERDEKEALIEGHLRQARAVVAAILGSTALLAGVVFFLASNGQMRPLAADAGRVQVLLAPLAIALLGGAPAMKRALFKRAEAVGFGGDAERWLTAHRTSVIVASAMREGSAVLGLLMALLTAEPSWSYLFSSLAIVAMLLDWPKASELGE